MNDDPSLLAPRRPVPASHRKELTVPASPPATAAAAPLPVLPHHKLIAYGVARSFLLAVLACRISDSELRNQATRAAKSACLNCAEGAGRVSRADKARVFAIARAEAVEAAPAVEIAALCGDAAAAPAREVAHLAHRLVGLLTGLCRPGA